jgi:hypothetical protein
MSNHTPAAIRTALELKYRYVNANVNIDNYQTLLTDFAVDEIHDFASVIDRETGLPELVEALTLAEAHLEYCNYGDKYERDCAMQDKLPQIIRATLARYEEGGTRGQNDDAN